MSPRRTDPPALSCPECGTDGLIPAQGRGYVDRDGNYAEHRGACRCHWCSWMWFDDAEPVTCGCGVRVKVVVDDGHAYAAVVSKTGPHV